MRIGMLTGGGDCPGLNAVIRAVVRKGVDVHGHSIVGFRHGWRGLMDGEVVDLGREEVRGILPRGGTILGSSRTNPYKSDDGLERVRTTLADENIDALIAIGGEDTLGVAHRLAGDGIRVVGVPKTIDNDLSATEMTFGFDTAVQTATDAIDRLHTTAESHDRVMVVEVMGRHAGWIALHSWARRRRERDPHPRAAVRRGRGVRAAPAPVAPGGERVDRRRRRGRGPGGGGDDDAAVGCGRRVRPRSARRRREPAHRRDQDPHRLRRPRHHPRPRAARRDADRVRPHPGDALRHRRHRRGARRRDRRDGRPAVR